MSAQLTAVNVVEPVQIGIAVLTTTLNVDTGELDHTKKFRDPNWSGSTKG